MTQNNSDNRAANGRENPPEPSRKTIQLAIAGIAIVAVGAFFVFKPGKPAPSSTQEESPTSSAAALPGDTAPSDAGKNWTAPRPPPVAVSAPPEVAPAPTPDVATPTASPPAAEPTPTMPSESMRQQMSALAQLDLSQTNLSQAQLTAYAQSLTNLMAQGQAAFVDATKQMTPAQIEQLAANMKSLAPDQGGALAVAAANAALTAAAQNPNKEDVGALFRVLQENGGPESVPQIESLANQWKYYSTIALANLDNNAGVPSLIRMVADADGPVRGNRNAALQVLAQVAPNSPEALTVLQDQAKANTIPFTTWINIASVLGGHEYQIGTMTPEQLPPEQAGSNMKSWHLELTKEDYYSIPNYSRWTDDQIKQRQDIISGLMQLTTDPTVKQLLEQSAAALANRGAPAAQPAPPQK